MKKTRQNIYSASPLQWAKEKLTRGSLIAFDLDKTVLEQGNPDEIEIFERSICYTIIHLVDQGYNIAAVTGNSFEQLSKRFTKSLIKELCHYRKLELLDRFHLFCNGASVYIRFPEEDIRHLVQYQNEKDLMNCYLHSEEELNKFSMLEIFDDKSAKAISYKFVDHKYLEQTKLNDDELEILTSIADNLVEKWWNKNIRKGLNKTDNSNIRSNFYINFEGGLENILNEEMKIECELSENKDACIYEAYDNKNDLRKPKAQLRPVKANNGIIYHPQIAVKDILSHRHAKNNITYAQDHRMLLIDKIKKELDKKGINKIAVTPGGRSTIDIAEQDSNKKEAISYLIRQLNIKGDKKKGEGEGINVLFFGDEVVLSGNDYEVNDIKDIQIFAVNACPEKVPINSQIKIPRVQMIGPRATDHILMKLSLITADLLGEYENDCKKGVKKPRYGNKTSVHLFREIIEKEIIREKLHNTLSLYEIGNTNLNILKAISTLVTVLTREVDLSAEVAEKLNRMIDDIGIENQKFREMGESNRDFKALGGSHWDT